MYPEFEDIVPPKVTAYIAAGLSVVGLGFLTTVFGFSEKVVFLQEKYFFSLIWSKRHRGAMCKE